MLSFAGAAVLVPLVLAAFAFEVIGFDVFLTGIVIYGLGYTAATLWIVRRRQQETAQLIDRGRQPATDPRAAGDHVEELRRRAQS